MMEWIERFNDAIGYIEEHLTEEIDYGQLGQIACCSSYHFQRMFTYMAGIPLSEYIRRRRMSLAAIDLQSKNMKIIDVDLIKNHLKKILQSSPRNGRKYLRMEPCRN